MENMTAVLKYALRDPRDKILAVTLSRKTAFETIDPTTTIDLTDKVYTFEDARTGEIMLSSMGQPLPGNPKEGPCVAVDFDLPDGQWTLNVITVSYKGGEKQTGRSLAKRCAGSSRMSRGLATSTGRRMPPSATTAP